MLAGATADNGMRPKGGYTSRGMVEIGGKTMLQWVVDALNASGRLQRVLVIGDAAADGVDIVLPGGDSFLDNIMLGLKHVESQDRALVVCSDIPLITGEAVSDFVRRAEETGADFCYPIISKQDCMSKYPGISRTYLKIREGTFTGGNMVLVSPEFMQRNEEVIKQAYTSRKNVVALARIIGFATLIRAVMAQLLFPSLLAIPRLEQRVGNMLGGSVRAVVSPYPEIGEDVDKLEDVEEIRKVMATAYSSDGSAKTSSAGSEDEKVSC